MTQGLTAIVRAQQRGATVGGSPFYAGLLDHVLVDVESDGPCAVALREVAAEPVADAGVLRFLRAVHELVLEGSVPDLARFYPSIGGTPGPGLGATFVATVGQHLDRVVERTREPLQTNEVGRSAALLGGFLRVAAAHGPHLRVLEIGASAGLNLHWDRYRYEAGGEGFGPVGSTVRFVNPWGPRGPHPHLGTPVSVVERRGCDVAPLDPADEGDRLRLRASVWPDQPSRRARLDAALDIAAAAATTVERADAGAWLAERLDETATGRATVVAHSIVLQYLSAASRRAVDAALAAAAARARVDAPLAWLRMEPASPSEAELRLTTWAGGAPLEEALGRCGFHGLPIRWSPPPGGAAGPRSTG